MDTKSVALEGVAKGSFVIIREPTNSSFGVVESVSPTSVNVKIWDDEPGGRRPFTLQLDSGLMKFVQFKNTAVERAEFLEELIEYGGKYADKLKAKLDKQLADVEEFRSMLDKLK